MARSATQAYLDARARLGIKFGLETIRALCARLEHPERRFPVLLIAGTNGKGSVAAYVDSALRASGRRTGRYTSPHLVRVNERITVDGAEIAGAALARRVARVRAAAEALVAEGAIPAQPTYFEVMTAVAFEHFRRCAVEVAVVEVGLGGRLDATNVVEPIASAIVSIDFDHQEFLGDTLASIAAEKAGVLRPGRTTVLGPLPEEARRVIAARARNLGARLVRTSEGSIVGKAGGLLEVRTPRGSYPRLRALPGAHQRDNLLVAVRLLEEAMAAGLGWTPRDLGRGIRSTRWPGRLERIEGKPPLLLDGAHNAAGARALAAELGSRGPVVLLFGAMADKDIESLGAVLFPLADAVVLTAPKMPRAAAPADVAARTGALSTHAHLEPDVRKALRVARRLAGRHRTVVVTGSLYLVGEVKRLLEREAAAAQRSAGLSRRRKWSRASGVSHSAGPTYVSRITPSRSTTKVSG